MPTANIICLKKDPVYPEGMRGGECGENLTWLLNEKTGKLTISGSGDMTDYDDFSSNVPWYKYTNLIQTITISEDVTSIGNGSFGFCKNVEEIIVPEGISRIGDYAFYHCEKLKSVSLPESLKEIGHESFSHCYNLTDVIIPSGVTTVGNAFFCCYDMESISILGDITKIGNWFGDCFYLTCVEIPESVTSIDEGAFESCDILTDVYYCGTPEMWEKISVGVSNENLQEATIHYNHKKGGEISSSVGEDDFVVNGSCGDNMTWSFDRYTGTLSINGSGEMYDITEDNPMWKDYRSYIKKIEISEGVTSIGAEAFWGTSIAYFDMKLPSSIESLGEKAFWSSFITGIDMPKTMKSIGAEAFVHCMNLESVRIPDGITRIEDSVFLACMRLQNVEIPASVTSIADNAFFTYYQLKNVSYGGTFEEWSDITIGEKNEYLTNATIRCSNATMGTINKQNPIPWIYQYENRKFRITEDIEPNQEAYIAGYDENGKFINVETVQTVGESVVVPENSASSRLFLMDENNQPLCAAVTVFNEALA